MNARLLLSTSRAHLTDLTVVAWVGQIGGHSCAADPAAGGGCSCITRFHGGWGSSRAKPLHDRPCMGDHSGRVGAALSGPWPGICGWGHGPWPGLASEGQVVPAPDSQLAPADRRTPFTPSVPHPAPISFTNRADAKQSRAATVPSRSAQLWEGPGSGRVWMTVPGTRPVL